MVYVTPKKAEKCAKEIIEWLKKHWLWQDVCIYVNGKRYSSYKQVGSELVEEYEDEIGEKYRVWVDNAEINQCVEYYNREHFLSMTFEGPLYEVLNFYGNDAEYDQKLEQEFCDILEKYGYYYELGYAWSLSAYKI